MKPDDTHREQLSALIDGELDVEQARFLLRRLQHDGELAGDLERWQLAADTLRGDVIAPGSKGFAERVAAAIADEDAPQVDEALPVLSVTRAATTSNAPRKAAAPQRWFWFAGGAMAASLGFAAMLSLRPASIDGDSVNAAPSVAAQSATAAEPISVAENHASMPTASTIEPAARMAETTVASAQGTSATSTTTARTTTRRIARAEPRPAASNRTATPSPVQAANASAIRIADALPGTPSGDDPFRQPQAKSSWPRVVIPGATSGTFNARLEQSGGYFQTQLPVQSRIGDNP